MSAKIHLYSAYYKPFPLLPNAYYVTPVQAGASVADIILPMQGDNAGQNISHLNRFYSELTVAYWVYKNADRSNFNAWGLVHYRRYLITNRYRWFYQLRSRYYFRTSQENLDSILTDELYKFLQKQLEENEILIQKPTWAKKVGRKSFNIRDAYYADHIGKDYDITMEVVKDLYPEYATSIDAFNKTYLLCFNNVMIARWEVWDTYLSFLFNILNEVTNRINIYKDGYQSRVFGFLAERLQNLFIFHNQLKAGHLTLGLFEDKL